MNATDPAVAFGKGDRVRLTRPVERFPHFIAPEGATGTVTEASAALILVHMDDTLAGAEEWDNQIAWSVPDGDTPNVDIAVAETGGESR